MQTTNLTTDTNKSCVQNEPVLVSHNAKKNTMHTKENSHSLPSFKVYILLPESHILTPWIEEDILCKVSHNQHKEPWKSVAPSIRNNLYSQIYSNISILAQSSTSVVWQVDKELQKEYAHCGQCNLDFIKYLFPSSYNVLPISNKCFTVVQYTHCKYCYMCL